MRRSLLLPIVAVVGLAAQPILAQAPTPAPAPAQPAHRTPGRPAAPAPAAPAPAQPAQNPYRPVAVTVPTVPRDPAFDALRKDLGEIAKRKDRAALAQRTAARDFFWERDFSGSFDPKRPSIDNLTAALSLDADDGSGWDALAAFAAETSAGPLPGRPSVVCAPAIPQFDERSEERRVGKERTSGW